jgi:hypothetical protein
LCCERLVSCTALAALAALAAACSDGSKTCGAAQPATAEATLVTAGAEAFRYADFHAAMAGDCPVELRGSVTITGRQVGSDFPLTFCVRREKDVKTGEPISLADAGFIEVVDVSALDPAGCSYEKDSGATPAGTITFDGFCTTGGTAFNLTLAGSIAGVRTCPASDAGPSSSTPVTLALAGSVLVTMDAP